MAYRVVLVPVMGDPAEEHALDVTRAITDMMRAHIIGIHVRPPSRMAPSGALFDPGYMPPSIIDAIERNGRAAAAEARDKFGKWRDAAGIALADSPPASGGATAEWHEVQAPIGEEVARRARTADLTVVARSGRQYVIDTDQTLHGALWESGRPVLLVPGGGGAGLFDTVVIAWNDSREAAHAVSAAWSLIGRARRLVVFIGGKSPALRHSADHFVSHLTWRGYAPATVVDDPSEDVGAGLLTAAEREKAGLLIMGAYSHSRLRHIVFGGATSFVLRNATIPVLLAH
jgi:nucleotide-binding universal stress UspA family protein